MSYKCDICNYETNDSGNYTRHKKTKKHLVNLDINISKINIQSTSSIPIVYTKSTFDVDKDDSFNKKFICKKCSFDTLHKSSYYRHIKKCNYNEDIAIKLEYSEKEKELYKKSEKEKSELLNNFMVNANVLLNKASDNTKITAQAMQSVSVSALKYANDKFKNAPALLPLENFNINNLDFDNQEDRAQLIETLIYNAKQKSLDKLLGDHIIKVYKKENPANQSFHVTDCSRLNFIVRELIENALIWSVDKNGIKICSSIVKPLIEKCINILLDHQKELLSLLGQGQLNKQYDIEIIIELLMSIDKGYLENDINKYIAPYFNLEKNKT